MIADRLQERTTEIRRDPQLAAVHVLLAALDATEYALLAAHARCPRLPATGGPVEPDDECDDLATAIVCAGRSLRSQLEQYRECCPVIRLAVLAPSNDDDSDIGF